MPRSTFRRLLQKPPGCTVAASSCSALMLVAWQWMLCFSSATRWFQVPYSLSHLFCESRTMSAVTLHTHREWHMARRIHQSENTVSVISAMCPCADQPRNIAMLHCSKWTHVGGMGQHETRDVSAPSCTTRCATAQRCWGAPIIVEQD